MFTLSMTRRKIGMALASILLVVGLFCAQTAQAAWPVIDIGNATPISMTAGQQTSNTVVSWKTFTLDLLKQVGMGIAKVLLNKMTEATINWINGGFQGSPKFVENPKSFFKDIGDTQLRNLVDTVGYNAAKFPYGRQISKLLIEDSIYKNGDFATRARATLDQTIGADWKRFTNDFSVGGWEAYDDYYQNPANNAVGMLFLAADEAAQKVSKAQVEVQTELNQGQGFLAQKTCVAYREGPKFDDNGMETTSNSNIASSSKASLQNALDALNAAEAELKNATPGTPEYVEIQKEVAFQKDNVQQLKFQTAAQNEHNVLSGGAKTDADCLQWQQLSPGSIVQSQIARALGSKFSQNELAQAMGNSLSSIINALTTTLLNKGLRALTTISSPDKTQTEWSYDGLTLSGQTEAGTNGSNWADTPDSLLDIQELFYTGQNTGLTDENGNPVKLTIIEQAQRQVDAYKNLIALINGGVQKNPDGSTTKVKSLASRIRDLDYAVPGPKLGWEKRLYDKIQSAQQLWTQRAQIRVIKKRKEEAAEIAERLGNLSASMPQQIKMQLLLANIPSYVDAQALIKNAVTYSLKQSQYFENYTDSLSVLSRLKSIKSRLDTILQNYVTPDYSGPITDTDLDQFLAQNPNSTAPVPNPFNYLSATGKEALKAVGKSYALLSKDLPNIATITEAEATYAQVKAQYDNITVMIGLVDSEKNQESLENIYQIQFGGRKNRFLQTNENEPALFPKVDKSTLSSTNQTLLKLMGFLAVPSGNPDLLSQLGLDFIPVIGDNDTPPKIYITPFSTKQIVGLDNSNASGFANIALITDKTRAQMVTELQNSYSASQLDAEHRTTFENMTDSQITLLYSIVTSTTTIDNLGYGWDPSSTGLTRLTQAIEVVDGYDGLTSDPKKPTSEVIFYCQSVLDKNDDQSVAARGAYLSLFRRPKVDITCDNIYDSTESDYTVDY